MKAFMLSHPGCRCALTMQTAAWALGLADRVPACIEVSFEKRLAVKVLARRSWHSPQPAVSTLRL